MSNLLLLILCFLLGIVLGRTKRFPVGAPAALNAFVINISLPALVLLHVHELRFDPSLLIPAITPWIVFGVGALVIGAVARRMNLPRSTTGCLMLLGGLGNTSFVGFPMIEAFYGREALGIGVVLDQVGSFLVLATAGLVVATRYSGGDSGPRETARRIFRFLPFWAMLSAFLLMPVEYPEPVRFVLGRLGDTLTPLALVSVGLQLKPLRASGTARALWLGLGWKMALAPALILLLGLLPGEQGRVLQVSVFEAAMPPMITAGVIAIEHDLDPSLASLLLGVGIPLGFLTVPLWWWLLEMVGP